MIASHRLNMCGVAYLEPLGADRETPQLTSARRLAWTAATAALLELVTLAGYLQRISGTGH